MLDFRSNLEFLQPAAAHGLSGKPFSTTEGDDDDNGMFTSTAAIHNLFVPGVDAFFLTRHI